MPVPEARRVSADSKSVAIFDALAVHRSGVDAFSVMCWSALQQKIIRDRSNHPSFYVGRLHCCKDIRPELARRVHGREGALNSLLSSNGRTPEVEG
jgi:hypothetical protein